MLDRISTSNLPLPLAEWTTDRVERLKSLWALGLSASQSATELGGTTRNAVISKLHRLGLCGHDAKGWQSLTPEQKEAHAAAKRLRLLRKRSAAARDATIAMGANPRRPSYLPEERPMPPQFLGLSVLQLNADTCHYPHGESGSYQFCGAKVITKFVCNGGEFKDAPASPYCAYHHDICHRAPATPEQIAQAAKARAAKLGRAA